MSVGNNKERLDKAVGIQEINLGQELMNVPMGTMVESIALAIAKAQWQLDKSSMTVAELMSGRRVLRDLDSGKLIDGDGKESTNATIIDSRVYFGYSLDADKTGNVTRVPRLLSMMELGFTPTFYQFVDTIIEVKIAISIRSEEEESQASTTTKTRIGTESTTGTGSSGAATYGYSNRGGNYWDYSSSYNQYRSKTDKHTVSTSQVNAAYTQKYGYTAEGASLLRTKLVPVPPPAILEERIRDVMRLENSYEQWNLLYLQKKAIDEELAAWKAKPEGTAEKATKVSALTARSASLEPQVSEAYYNLTGGEMQAPSPVE